MIDDDDELDHLLAEAERLAEWFAALVGRQLARPEPISKAEWWAVSRSFRRRVLAQEALKIEALEVLHHAK